MAARCTGVSLHSGRPNVGTHGNLALTRFALALAPLHQGSK
jgi:hypothetical protein